MTAGFISILANPATTLRTNLETVQIAVPALQHILVSLSIRAWHATVFVGDGTVWWALSHVYL